MDPFLWLIFALFVTFMIYATAESASQLLNKFKLQRLLDKYRKRSALARRLLPEHSGALRSILSFGRMLSLAALAVAVAALTDRPPVLWLSVAAAATAAALYLPTLLAVANPQGVLKLLLPVAKFGNVLLLPLTWPALALFRKSTGRMRERSGQLEVEEEAEQMEAYLDAGEEEGLFEPGEVELVRQVLEFGDTIVREVMTPRVEMICLDRSATLQGFQQTAAEHKYSRFPVIEENVDNVVGIAHIKTLLTCPPEKLGASSVAEIASQPYFVPESKRVFSLLREFQQSKQQMAIVVDEYGGTAGLITLEDILEEIVGEIEDEHELEGEEDEIVVEPDGSLLVAGHVDVDEVEEKLGLKLDDEMYETVSGLALNHLKHLPRAGEKFVTRGVEVEIVEADEKSILKLRLHRIEDDAGDA